VYTSVKKVTKTRYSKILVAIDGSKESMNAARYAIGLAKKDRARVIALTAMRLPKYELLLNFFCQFINQVSMYALQHRANAPS
jgi:nucleotide-binding universal stress UspA family protein